MSKHCTSYCACIVLSFSLPYAALEGLNIDCDKPAVQTRTEPSLERVSKTAKKREVFCSLKEESRSFPKKWVIKISSFLCLRIQGT